MQNCTTMIKQSERAVNTEGESIVLDTIVEKIAIFEANVHGDVVNALRKSILLNLINTVVTRAH